MSKSKVGLERLTDDDIKLLIEAVKAIEPSYYNTSKPILLSVQQRQAMILVKLEQEQEERAKS